MADSTSPSEAWWQYCISLVIGALGALMAFAWKFNKLESRVEANAKALDDHEDRIREMREETTTTKANIVAIMGSLERIERNVNSLTARRS